MIEKRESANDPNQLKYTGKMVPVFVTVLLVASVLFYKERMLFIDAPHVLFRLINDGHLEISDFRFGSFITQVVPLAGSFLHLPIKLLMVLYSASFYLFYLSVVLLLVYCFKEYGLAILFGLYLVLFVSDTFYWPNNEIHQGVGWLMLSLAASRYMAQKKWPFLLSLPVFIGLFYLAIWTHPLVMMVAVFTWFFLWMTGDCPFYRWHSMVYTGVLLALSWLKFNQSRQHGYDSIKIEGLTGFQPSDFVTLFHSPQVHFFMKSALANYWLVVLLFAGGILALIKIKKYLLLLWTAGFAAVYLVLIFIIFPDSSPTRFYIESEYMPLSIICSAPFVFYLLPTLQKKTGVILLLLVFFTRFLYIYDSSAIFRNRFLILAAIREKMVEKNLTKILIPEPVPQVDSALIMTWGAPVESILWSAIKGDRPLRTFIFTNRGDLGNDLEMGKDTLIGCWDLRGPAKLNQHYFIFDTSVRYQQISYENLMR